jgi:hypothetical protein
MNLFELELKFMQNLEQEMSQYMNKIGKKNSGSYSKNECMKMVLSKQIQKLT